MMREGRATRDVTRQKRLEREIVAITDRERQRLGREPHDGLCQTLAGIAALSSSLSRRLPAESETHASAAAEITRQSAKTLKLSIKTIESNREHTKHKLDLGSATELVHRATQWVEAGARGD